MKINFSAMAASTIKLFLITLLIFGIFHIIKGLSFGGGKALNIVLFLDSFPISQEYFGKISILINVFLFSFFIVVLREILIRSPKNQ